MQPKKINRKETDSVCGFHQSRVPEFQISSSGTSIKFPGITSHMMLSQRVHRQKKEENLMLHLPSNINLLSLICIQVIVILTIILREVLYAEEI